MKFVPVSGYYLIHNQLILIVTGLLFSYFSFAQELIHVNRISPQLAQKLKVFPPESMIRVVINVIGKDIPEQIRKPGSEIKRVGTYGNSIFFELTVSVNKLFSTIALLPEVIFIEDGARTPKEELLLKNLDLSLNKVNAIHSQFPQWNGDGINLSVKENKPDTTDIDFKNRFMSTTLSSNTVSSHASIMATMSAGGGNSWHLGKGVAWGSKISSSDFASLLPDAISSYQQYNISVQNHSYGVGIENYYGADAAAYDATVISIPELLHVFSSGNSGQTASTTGSYSGIKEFANLTGSFKMAKNILTVGATDSFGVVASLSSKGPAYDGRVKPELVAFGEDGSSGAAALVSGVALVLQHQYKQIRGSLPANSLLKAILINSADDVGNAEVDYSNGYGSLNAMNAVKTIQTDRYMNGSVNANGIQTFGIAIPAGIKKVKITLAWTDPSAIPNAAKALVNDLDLELVNLNTAELLQPWVLNSYPHVDSLNKSATRKRDSLNNAEQIAVSNPASGNYQIRVKGFNVTGSTQNFHIAYQFDSTDIFTWSFPTKNDFIFSSAKNTIRWSSSFPGNTSVLAYSTDFGVNWHVIENAVNLSSGYYSWQAPGEIKSGLLRMEIGSNQFLSDTFTIAQRTITGVGFNCPDSFLFYWKKLPNVNTYRVYKLGDKYLEPVTSTQDSFIVLSKIVNTSLHYTVAPVIGNLEGVKSYTFNYTTQGVECYIRSFLSALQNNTAKLLLTLGTDYDITKVVLEKYDGRNFVSYQQLNTISSLLINFTDSFLNKGINNYRIRLDLSGGRTVYSLVETVYYFSGTEYIIYPNPIRQNQPITILCEDPFPTVSLQVFTMNGQKIMEKRINDLITILPTGKLNRGLYLFRFLKEGIKEKIIKVVIL